MRCSLRPWWRKSLYKGNYKKLLGGTTGTGNLSKNQVNKEEGGYFKKTLKIMFRVKLLERWCWKKRFVGSKDNRQQEQERFLLRTGSLLTEWVGQNSFGLLKRILETMFRTPVHPPVSKRVWGKKEEMATAECPCSPEQALASSQGWHNLEGVSLKPLCPSALLLHGIKSEKPGPCESGREQKCVFILPWKTLLQVCVSKSESEKHMQNVNRKMEGFSAVSVTMLSLGFFS